MRQQSADVCESRFAQLGRVRRAKIAVVGRREHIGAIASEVLREVQSAAVLIGVGFGHERGVQPVTSGHGLHDETCGGDRVRERQRVGECEIDLVLAGRDLVMCGLDTDAHLFQRERHVAAREVAAIDRAQVEI